MSEYTEYEKRVWTTFIAPLDLPEHEARRAMGFIQETKLCPFRNQVTIRAQKYKKELKAVLITTINGYRARAAATGRYMASTQAPEVECDDNGLPIFCTAWVRVWDEHTKSWYDIPHQVLWREYAERKTDYKQGHGRVPSGPADQLSSYQGNWATMPVTMLAKCAEVGALRKAFPECDALMIEEEMPDLAPAPSGAKEKPKAMVCDSDGCEKEVKPAQAAESNRLFHERLCEDCHQTRLNQDEVNRVALDKAAELANETEPEQLKPLEQPEPEPAPVETQATPVDPDPVPNPSPMVAAIRDAILPWPTPKKKAFGTKLRNTIPAMTDSESIMDDLLTASDETVDQVIDVLKVFGVDLRGAGKEAATG